MFKRAWDEAFTKKNIQLAFRKSGIWPTDSIHIIKSISVPTNTLLPKPPGVLKTLKSVKSIYRFRISYESSLSADKIKTLFSTTLKLSAEVSILQYQKRSLEKAINLQNKKNRQGIRLNLCGESNKGKVNCSFGATPIWSLLAPAWRNQHLLDPATSIFHLLNAWSSAGVRS
jgi:hypothetical protein